MGRVSLVQDVCGNERTPWLTFLRFSVKVAYMYVWFP